MSANKGLTCIAALALLAFACHVAIGASSDDVRATYQANSVDASDDTASIPDFDGDGTIGFGDFVMFAGVFGARQDDEKYEATYDLNGDGEIGFSDFVIFAQNFGKAAPSPAVAIPDANLRAAIEAALGKTSGATITVADMKGLTELLVPGAGISDLTGLEFAVNLKHLNTQYNFNIRDVSPLAGLTNLQTFVLGCNGDSDLSPLAGLTNLTELWLAGNNIRDVSPLAGLTSLGYLVFLKNDIRDISPLAGLHKLYLLDLRNNNIRDVSPLSGLKALNSGRFLMLQLGDNDITDISPLAGLTSPELMELHLENNNIRDVSPLAGLSLRKLNLGGNNIRDITPLSDVTNLQDLLLGFNNITDIPWQVGLTSLTSLTYLDLKFNSIRDISSLSGLSNNQTNPNCGSYPCRTQIALDLRGNPLGDSSINDHISDLESNGVRVLFDLFRKGDFDIELVFLDDVSELQKNVTQYAVKRWMSVIVEDLPDYTFAQGFSGTCGGQSYAIPSGEQIDDLRIYFSTNVDAIFAIGLGKPDLLRATTHLPVVGCMQIDVSNINALLSITLHEIGHVLGFGTVWEKFGFRQDLSFSDRGADTHFNGPRAIAAFDDAGGRDYRGKKVPVQQRDGAHWRLGVLTGEVMTAVGDGEAALSAITVQSLADLGYGVDVTRADPYNTREPYDYLSGTTATAKISAVLPSTPTLSNGHALPEVPQLWCGVGEEREPIHVIDPQGNVIRTLGD